MIRVTAGANNFSERHVLLEIEEEGALYLAEVLRENEPHDGGALAIVEAIDRYFKKSAV